MPVRLKVAWAVDELLLTVAVREAIAAEWELGKEAVEPSNFDKASLARSMRLGAPTFFSSSFCGGGAPKSLMIFLSGATSEGV